MSLQALVLDYGNVLSRPQREEWLDAMAGQVGAQAEEFRAVYWRHRHPYDCGLPAAEYWHRVLGTLRPHVTAHDSRATIDRLIEMDVSSWTDYREEVWSVARAFRSRGGRTAILSNGVPEIMARVRADRPLDAWFDVVIVSCEVGVAKPDPKIFELCLARLDAAAADALFVDDRIENVEAAARLGMRTLHFVDAGAVGQLTDLIGVDART